MEIFSLFMAFVVVRVSSYTIINYIKEVAVTNAHIELANNMNNFTINDKFVLNGLEHVIKKIIGNNDYDLGMMNNMIAVPESEYLKNWIVCKNIQIAMQQEIQNELKIAVPQISDRHRFEYTHLSTLQLKDLGAERRDLTGQALKNILNRTINYGDPENVTNLLEERKRQRTCAFENRIVRALAGPEKETSVLWICQLIALYMNTKFSTMYITKIETNSVDTCVMTHTNRFFKKTYRKIEGQWCEVIVNELHNEVVQPLKEQLL